ncbi:hypothetical protein BDA96_02G227200 [Sorghum bicolor]|uniref:Uncharacterized protein n=1 Tax=Sorghum bicolor TaxID=4558 RepID=A0A921UTF2_SORBI|nr:hypothetical protein BDA96_02G227200 [Sorghum bicolor]
MRRSQATLSAPPSTEPTPHTPTPSPAAPPTTAESRTVTFAISMEERKGFLHVLRALRDVRGPAPQALLVLTGDPDLASLRCLLFNLCSAGAAASGSLSLRTRSSRCATRSPTSTSAPATPSPPSDSPSPPSTPASSIPRRCSPSRDPDLVRRPQLAAGPRSS